MFDHLAHAGCGQSEPPAGPPPDRQGQHVGQTFRCLWRIPSRGRPSMPIASRSRRATPAPHRNAWCGEATGRVPAKRRTRSRTTPCCLICWQSGCRTKRHGIASWWRTPPSCTISPPDGAGPHQHRMQQHRHQEFIRAGRSTPTFASWLNAVEGYLTTLTKRRLKRGLFRSRQSRERNGRLPCRPARSVTLGCLALSTLCRLGHIRAPGNSCVSSVTWCWSASRWATARSI